MHEKPRTSRPRRTAAVGRKTSQHDTYKAGKKRKISKASENWRDELLASGPGRGVHFEVELGAVTAVSVRRIHHHPTGRTWDRVFLCPINGPEDFAEFEAWLNEYYPITPETGR